ncbi:hypothetical protein BGW80DRAFT_542850 [Lactifluus volemus]|nr:hypothetical protein BGW80DRAFT_542850 [Lactifluus volemus]
MLEYVGALGGDRGRGIGCGRSEGTEEGDAIVIGALRATRTGSRSLPVGGAHPFFLDSSTYFKGPLARFTRPQPHSRTERAHTLFLMFTHVIVTIGSYIDSYMDWHKYFRIISCKGIDSVVPIFVSFPSCVPSRVLAFTPARFCSFPRSDIQFRLYHTVLYPATSYLTAFSWRTTLRTSITLLDRVSMSRPAWMKSETRRSASPSRDF